MTRECIVCKAMMCNCEKHYDPWKRALSTRFGICKICTEFIQKYVGETSTNIHNEMGSKITRFGSSRKLEKIKNVLLEWKYEYETPQTV